MKEVTLRESLELLKAARADLTRNTHDRAGERIDEVITLIEKALEDGSYRSLSSSDLLNALSRVIAAGGQIASLVDTILKSL
jgi:hypothetical protein